MVMPLGTDSCPECGEEYEEGDHIQGMCDTCFKKEKEHLEDMPDFLDKWGWKLD